MQSGSPPPTRGTRLASSHPIIFLRITPAYAGNTGTRKPYTIFARDHPRLRGEQRLTPTALGIKPGSPPPTRGTLSRLLPECTSSRITPAYAGNTVSTGYLQILIQDHPRLRGEHSPTQVKAVKCIGSPPPTRGTLTKGTLLVFVARITPAYAGNTIQRYIQPGGNRDHPRLRGEHSSNLSVNKALAGSPPPTRGTPDGKASRC